MSELLSNLERKQAGSDKSFSQKAFALGLLLGACLAMVLLLRPAVSQDLPQAHQNPALQDSINLIEDALQQINSDYIHEIPAEQLAEAALKGIFTELDNYSKYLNEENYQKLIQQTDGEYLGIGIDIENQEGQFFISAIIPDSPAAKIGLTLGDEILSINGKQVQNHSYQDVIELIRETREPNLALSLLRAEETFEVQLSREFIAINSVQSTFIPQTTNNAKKSDTAQMAKGIVYSRIRHFNEFTAEDLQTSLLELKNQHPSLYGLVLDLRNNPGGLVDSAVEVSDLFLQKGTIVSANGRSSDADFKFRAERGEIFADIPLVVLINGATASAAEIVAAALKEQDRAILVGQTTYGKGLVQTIIPIHSGALKLTTSRYYTPSGLSINERGIRPHIKSLDSDMLMAINEIQKHKKNSLPHFMAIKDPALLRAWQYLNDTTVHDQVALDGPNAQ